MEQLKDVLPYLRPRSAELTWYVALFAILLGLGLLALVVFYAIRWQQHRSQIDANFLHHAAERGLHQEQAQFLLHLARKHKLRDPLLLLSSVHLFDHYLGRLADQLADRNPADPQLEQIGKIRLLLGFDTLPADQPMRSTRQLPIGITLMVWPGSNQAEEAAPWIAVARNERGIAIAPLLRDNALRQFNSLREGDLLTIHFWREGDTEYLFVSEVLALDPQTRTALIRHVDPIERLQQRDFFRLPVYFPIQFYLLPREEEELPSRASLAWTTEDSSPPPGLGEAEASPFPDLAALPRLEGQVINLSAGGLAASIPELVPEDQRLLIDPQFAGPFPLEGILCQVVQVSPKPGGYHLQLHFVDLPPGRERELVRQIYEHQTHSRHEAPQPSPPFTSSDNASPSTS